MQDAGYLVSWISDRREAPILGSWILDHGQARSAIALIIIFWANLRFTSLQGFLGIYEINYFWSVTITLITIVGLINCFNLVDGIDGLAAGVSSVSLIAMGVWFGIVGQNELMMISFILAGALLSFIPYNVYGHTNKIFLGDTGSLL